MAKSGRDFLTAAGAHELANTIREFWAEKGHVVRVSVTQEGGHLQGRQDKVLSIVRSNLLNGLPRTHRVIDEEKPGRRWNVAPGQKGDHNALTDTD
jgi:hypothetical protein